MVGLTRTVVAPSVELTERRFKAFMWLVEIYRRMLIELVNYDFKKEHRLLKRDKYCKLRGSFRSCQATIFTQPAKTLR